MSSVADKRTSLEYNMRPAVNPGQSFQDFALNIPDQAIQGQSKKHSEFKKPYLSDSYQGMDYQWDGYNGYSPRFDVPIAPITPRHPIPSPGDDPSFPVPPPPPAPGFPIPKIYPPPPGPPSSPRPGDNPTQTPSFVLVFRKCCIGLNLSGPATAKIETPISIVYGGGNTECSYELQTDTGSFDGGTSVYFEGGGGGTATLNGIYYPGTATITIKAIGTATATSVEGRAICKSISIEITACECNSAYIAYTTQQMAVNESQNLTVGNPVTGSVYTWVLSGGGSLSTYTGSSTTYTAPAANENCLQNATITLKCDNPEETCDTLQIAINAVTDTTIAYWLSVSPGTCTREYGGWFCFCTCNRYYCTGGVSPTGCVGTGIYDCTPLGSACTNCRYPTPYDVRTEAQKAAGCCPAALI